MKKLLFYTFLLFTLKGKCQDTLTIGEVFDFSVNDEFQSSNSTPGQGSYPNATRMKIIGKWYSAANDTVFYIRYFDNYNSVFYSYRFALYLALLPFFFCFY